MKIWIDAVSEILLRYIANIFVKCKTESDKQRLLKCYGTVPIARWQSIENWPKFQFLEVKLCLTKT